MAILDYIQQQKWLIIKLNVLYPTQHKICHVLHSQSLGQYCACVHITVYNCHTHHGTKQ